MPSLSSTARKRRSTTSSKFKVMGEHKAFLSRIKKSLYYGRLPTTERFSMPISELAAELYTEVKSGRSLDRLDVEDAASLSRNACVSPCSLVLALLYLERLKTCNPEYLYRIAPSELFLVSLMVASKFLHDDGEDDEVLNEEWAASAGLEVAVINRYERDFLQAIEWELFVSEQAFWKRLSGVERDVALREGKRRGWFSYTDLDNLLESVVLGSIAQAFVTISAICLTSYTASVLTLIGSAIIVSHVPGTSMNTASLPTQPHTPQLLTEDSPLPLPRTHPLVDHLTTGFILASLTSNNTSTHWTRDGTANERNTDVETSENNWTAVSNWVSKLVGTTWHWCNVYCTYWQDLQASLSREYVEPDTKIIEFVANHEAVFRYGRNKSWAEESDIWKEMRKWLLVTGYDQSQQGKFFSMGITNHY